MARKRLDLTGQTKGWLVILGISDKTDSHGRRLWTALCQCGAITTVSTSNFNAGHVQSCGCLRRSKVYERSHGHTAGSRPSPEYRTWRAMKARCLNPRHQRYARYGGRGIAVCPRWLESFEAFLADVGPRPNGTTLDRIDCDGGYEPSNVRWATPAQQQRNRSDNHWITVNGERRTLQDWADLLGVSAATIHYRLERGWDPARAVTEPPRRNCSKNANPVEARSTPKHSLQCIAQEPIVTAVESR